MPQLTGTLASGSAVVTGLASTSSLIAGMPVSSNTAVWAQGTPFPIGTTIASVDSASQITASAAAATTGPVSLFFGPMAWLDRSAFHGQARDAFGTATGLVVGHDYSIKPDMPDGVSCRSALLQRDNGVWPPAVEYTRGLLAPALVPARGCIKVVYAGGFLSGAVPKDIELAVNLITADIKTRRLGRAIGSEGYDGYSYSLVQGKRVGDPLDVGMPMLRNWRRYDLGG